MTREEEIRHIFNNKDVIIAQKKSAMKKADAVNGHLFNHNTKVAANKAEGEPQSDPNILNAKLVINTCNIIDSHMDCHINGIWNKTVKEVKMYFLLQEHVMKYDHIIADSAKDSLKASVETISWSQLGQPYSGNTEALVFSAGIPNDRNKYMYEQYSKGYVLNHSVGMHYVKLFLCIDSEEPMYSAEKESWDKYYPVVMNKDVADERGYFWAVTEAKMVEGSAVVIGSNEATPVIEIEVKNPEIEEKRIDKIIEPLQSTQETEPPKGTQEKKTNINLLLLS